MPFISTTIIEAIANLRIAPLRTSLALMGIAIGCAAVVAILQIGFIAERQILKDLEQAGLNMMVAMPSYEMESSQDGPTPPPESATEVEARLTSLPTIRHAALVKEHHQEIQIQGESTYIQIIGATQAFPEIAKLALSNGNFDAVMKGAAPVGILGADVTKDLMRPVSLDVGDYVRLGFDGYKLGGLLAPAAYNSMIGLDVGRALLVPEQSLGRLTQSVSSWRMVIDAAPEASKDEIEETVKAIFRNDYGIEIDIQSSETLIAAKQAQQRNLTLLLTALGGVALLVGTVGVANVMLAAVAERRKEIGLRMAIGASPGDVSALFLMEAVVLCCFGGLIGTLIGVIGSNLYASVSLADVTISYGVLGAALLMSTLTGIVAGYYPARQSSKLDPVEALQSE